jgi:hypothetical protein
MAWRVHVNPEGGEERLCITTFHSFGAQSPPVIVKDGPNMWWDRAINSRPVIGLISMSAKPMSVPHKYSLGLGLGRYLLSGACHLPSAVEH